MSIKVGERVNSQYVFLNGNSSIKTIDFDSPYIKCQNDETLSICVEEFSMKLSSYVIPEGTRITFTRLSDSSVVLVTLQAGTYSCYDLSGYVTSLMGSLGRLVYNQYNNLFTFSLANASRIGFSGDSHKFFGFASADVLEGTSVTSTSQVSLKPFDNIIIKQEGLNGIANGNIDNFQSGNIRNSDVLCMIPFHFKDAFSTLYFHNESNRYQMFIREKSIDTFDLSFCDTNDDQITFIGDYVVILRFDTYKTEAIDTSVKQTETLEKILQLFRDMCLLANLDQIDLSEYEKNLK
jgi:hypothetical protein